MSHVGITGSQVVCPKFRKFVSRWRFATLLILTISLTACGGGSGDDGDTVAPTVTAPAEITVEATSATGVPATDAAVTAFLAGSTAFDAKDPAPVFSNNAPVNFPLGATLVTFTYTDAANNAGSANATVNVVDTTAPVVTAPASIIVEAPGRVAINAFLAASTSVDIVNPAPLVSTNAPANFPLGATLVTFTHTDASGNVGTDTATVTVIDTVAPVVTTPVNIIVEAAAAVGTAATNAAIGSFLSGASVVEAGDLSPVLSTNAPAIFPLGVTQVTFTSTDWAGNAGMAVASVTVVDTTVPAVTSPGNITVEAQSAAGTPAGNGAIVMFLAGSSVTDTVDPASVFSNNAPITFPLGATVVTFTYTDASGNAGMAVASVTVVDTTAPVITLTGDTVTLRAGNAFVEPGISATDGIDGNLTQSITVGGNLDTTIPGAYTITYNVVDTAQNAAIEKTRSVTVIDPTFAATPIVIPAFSEYYSDDCQTPTIMMAIPVRLNNDVYEDFIVHYWCGVSANLTGTVITDATPDALVAYVSDSNGDYTVSNQSVFGEERPKLGGASRKYARGDINGDGIDDFAFAMNWEDGRAADGQNALTNTTEPSVLLSGENNSYSIHRPGARAWGHAVDMVDNSMGTKDVVFVGFVGEHFQAFRLVNDVWTVVVNEYPTLAMGAGSWANTFKFFPAPLPGNESESVIGNYGTSTQSGIALFRKNNGNWTRTDEYLFTKDFETDFITWQQTLTTIPVYTINGTQYVHVSVAESCIAHSLQSTPNPVYIGKLSVGKTIGGIVEGQLLTQDELIAVQIFLFFEIVNNELVELAFPFVNEESEINANFFDCDDINSDGYDDLVVSAYTSHNDNRLEGGLPVIYLNDQQGNLVNVDRSSFPWYGPDRSQGYLHDVNSDGILDLVLFEREANLHTGINIYLGNAHVSIDPDNP